MSRFEEVNLRAGLLGLPFCTIEYVLNRRPIFVLGGGFFAALLFTGLSKWWTLGRPSIWESRETSGRPIASRNEDDLS